MQGAQAAERARMLRVAQRPNTEVLEYAYETAEREADAVMCVKLATSALEARSALAKDPDARSAARRICEADGALRQFSRTHPQTFLAMMDLKNGGRALEMLTRLARLRQSVQEGMTEAEANVHANRIIMERTMREPTESERQNLVLS